MAKKKRKGLLFDDVREAAGGFFSLDPQEDVSTRQQAAEMALGFVPGVGQAMALRDFERARRAGDRAGMAMAAAGLLPGGKLLPDASAMRRDIFIGPKSKSWNQKAADQAVELEKRGAKPEEIWQRTGTFRGPDKKLRQEISDQEMRLLNEFGYQPRSLMDKITGKKVRGEQQGRFKELLENKPLTEAYPELAEYRMQLRKLEKNQPENIQKFTGQFRPSSKFVFAQRQTPEGALDTLTHEYQHAVQNIEGFPGGTSLESMMKIGAKNKEEAMRLYRADPGEMEARAAALRRKLSEKERRARFPLQDFRL